MKKNQLKFYLNYVLFPDYNRFKLSCIDRCGWTTNQWAQRYNGRTPLTQLEQNACEDILAHMYPSLKDTLYENRDGNSNA